MYYSEDLIEEVRSRNDIVDVISGYVRLQRKGSSYFGLCPFHSEKSPSFSVSPGKQMYYCFGCGAGGNVFTFLMEYENFTFPEAVKTLADRCGVDLPEVEYSEEARQQADLKSRLLEIQKKAAKYYYYQLRQPKGRVGYEYLRGRELSDETIQKFGLGYSGQQSREQAVRIKLGALRSCVEGKRVVMIDDSIVRGTTSRQIVSLLREAGAAQVHMRVSSPPFLAPCHFGTDIPDRDELIACRYSMEEIQTLIGADSLAFLRREDLHQMVPDATCGFCEGCFTGTYPIRF